MFHQLATLLACYADNSSFSLPARKVRKSRIQGSCQGDTQSGKLLFELYGQLVREDNGAFSPDGKTVLTGGWDGAIIWDVRTGKPMHTLQVPTDTVG